MNGGCGESSSQPMSMNSLDCSWDYTIELECIQGTQDLQLAAELGKTLLERNKDLENLLKHHQNIIEDNNQEIEYLTKQTIALKEVNDSRLRIYEQLEVNIQDLERANHRLAVENSVDKKLIKNLTSNVETLEARCEELQSGIEDLRAQVDVLRRRGNGSATSGGSVKSGTVGGRRENRCSNAVDGCRSLLTTVQNNEEAHMCNNTPPRSSSDKTKETQTSPRRMAVAPTPTHPPTSDVVDNAMEQIELLMNQLRESRDRYSLDQHRIMELEEQLTALTDQNRLLEKQLVNAKSSRETEGGKTMHEEFTTLEEVRQGQLCQRCLRTVESGNGMDFDLSSLCDAGMEDDDHSMIDALTSATSAAASGITPNQHRHRTSFTIEVQEYAKNSPPQVNLYKELVEKYEALLELHRSAIPNSRQEELQTSGEFSANTSNLNMKDTDDESGQGDSLQPEKQSKQLSQTPTDFSEAETSSSGFADETSNKGTQTSLTDHQEDQANKTYDSRFKANPEYKELFRDIFNTLKKDSEKEVDKEEVAKPQIDFINTFDNMTDDSRSVLSCTMSDVSLNQMEPVTVIECVKPERVLTPYIRQPLEYISVAVNARKRSSSRRNKNKLQQQQERSDSPMTHIVGSPKITYANRPTSGQRRRSQLSSKGTPEKTAEVAENNTAWQGNSLQFFNRNAPSPTPSQSSCKSGGDIEFKPSQASHDLHALKKLDKSYADVLKNANRRAGNGQRRAKYNT